MNALMEYENMDITSDFVMDNIICSQKEIIDKIYNVFGLLGDLDGIDPVYIQAIAEQESDYHYWAVRFEPGFYYTYIHKKYSYNGIKAELGESGRDLLRKVSLSTEEFSRACSWGVMQVMGQVMRERGYRGILHHVLFIPEIGIEYGIRQFHRHWKWYKGDLNKALHAYNGGTARGDSGSFPYVIEVKNRIERIKKNGRYDYSH